MEDKIKKTSSDSTQPKIKLALEEKYKEENKKEADGYERLKTKESAKLPKPTGWRILVNVQPFNKKFINIKKIFIH